MIEPLVEKLVEADFKDIFKPAGKEELEARFAPVFKRARETGMKDLKPGDVFKITTSSARGWTGETKIAASSIFISTEWIGEPMPVVIYKKTKKGTNILGAVRREELFGRAYLLGAVWREELFGRAKGYGYWFPAFTNSWVLNHMNKVVQ